MKVWAAAGLLTLAAAAAPAQQTEIFDWEQGIALRPRGGGPAMYLWFYEWNLFEAMEPGQYTPGTYELARRVSADGRAAAITSPALSLTAAAAPDGAELTLRIANLSGRDWGELAAIVPCWNPGRTERGAYLPENRFFHVPRTPEFADTDRGRTFFPSAGGLAPLNSRAIHFNTLLRPVVDAAAREGGFAFSNKWPTSKEDASAGLLIRESADGKWVTGIGWQDFLSVQGHNPWNCLHVSVRAGPLRRKDSKTIRGRLYLFKGGKPDCLERFRRDFGSIR